MIEQNLAEDEKVISFSVLERELKKSNYNTKGTKVLMPLFFGIFGLIWFLTAWNGGFWGIIGSSLCFGGLFAVVIYLVVTAVDVSNAIKRRDFHVARAVICKKKYRPGNAEDGSVCILFFERFGRFRPENADAFETVKEGDEYYVLLCGKSKKIRFIYDVKEWKIDEGDFICEKGTYLPVKR